MDPYPGSVDTRPSLEFVLCVLAVAGIVALAVSFWRAYRTRPDMNAEYRRIRALMGVPASYVMQKKDLDAALRHEATTGELPEFTAAASETKESQDRTALR